MIISKVRGGLGNQLFQYAAGLALAQKHQTELYLDTSVYDRNKTREFELQKLGLKLCFADQQQIEDLKRNNFYKQPFYHFDYKFGLLPNDTFIRGYFCSEKYFSQVSDELAITIRGAISKTPNLSNEQLECLDSIDSQETVSIHVRRGDYVSNQDYNQFFGTCDTGYYNAAKHAVEALCSHDVRYVVFSDEIEWAKKNLELPKNTIYMNLNTGEQNYLDLLFMARCKHNILANSTFSWWAGLCNLNPEKIVIGPSGWFKTNYRETSGPGAWIKSPFYYTGDLFPADWIAL